MFFYILIYEKLLLPGEKHEKLMALPNSLETQISIGDMPPNPTSLWQI